MRDEEVKERSNERPARRIYEKLWATTNDELSKARQEWRQLQESLAEVKMMEFATGGDETLLLPEEEQLLEEMNQKLEAAQKAINFWSRRAEKLYQYKDQVDQFFFRLENDIELHKLRLDLSRHLMSDHSTTSDSSTGQRRVRLY